LIVHFNNSVDHAHELRTAVLAEGGNAEAVQANLSTDAGTVCLASSVAAVTGGLDILVANARVSKAGSFEDHNEADFELIL
jgi:NAD(P)-dependent dehydrogenase (short-subunit alcohol dehydrogenase family)